MKKFKFYYLFAFVALGLFVTSCGDDDETDGDVNNIITITVEEPLDGETIAESDCGDVHVHVDVMASDENHEVDIVLHTEGDVDDEIITWDKHDHDQLITFETEVDLCMYPAGTCFHLEVEACIDHDCENKETHDVEFCLQ